MLGMRYEPALRGVDDALLLARRHGKGGIVEAGACLDLDEGDQVAAARDDVDLAMRRAVAPRQQQRIATAASLWLAAHPDHANLDCRFDVILIAPRRLPRHLEAAFETSSF